MQKLLRIIVQFCLMSLSFWKILFWFMHSSSDGSESIVCKSFLQLFNFVNEQILFAKFKFLTNLLWFMYSWNVGIESIYYLMIEGCAGVCMMSSKWRDEQHPSFINFISSFLSANSFRLNFVLVAPVITFLFLLLFMYLLIYISVTGSILRAFFCRILFSTVEACQFHLFL